MLEREVGLEKNPEAIRSYFSAKSLSDEQDIIHAEELYSYQEVADFFLISESIVSDLVGKKELIDEIGSITGRSIIMLRSRLW